MSFRRFTFHTSKNRGKWLSALLWVPVGLVFTKCGYTVMAVRGTSMQPTLNPEPLIRRDIAVFDRYSVSSLHDVRRGDIVAFKSPGNANELLVKRVLALEGDVVQTLPPYPDKEVTIPAGHSWVEGDESFRTFDSNRFGPIPLGLVDSKVMFILWPLNRFGWLSSTTGGEKISSQGSPWRKGHAEVERERWRSSRVTVKSKLD
ncbi:LexA/Signal peptidase [Rickenella mellea]|uniref:Mitochondrial inner membrane protease subunit n=1 Tax=Rickenella mellea TaxID=50990 RepID=A0A4V3AZM7_9AGAM|nr:LexA/Signal peptidase [Rickenella mellea]